MEERKTWEYVVGYLIKHTAEGSEVLMIRKLKPAAQVGKLNGLGGKREPGESYGECMIREFKEECGLDVKSWLNFGVMIGQDWNCELFVSIYEEVMGKAYSVENERVAWYKINEILTGEQSTLPNVPAHLAIALHSLMPNNQQFSKALMYYGEDWGRPATPG